MTTVTSLHREADLRSRRASRNAIVGSFVGLALALLVVGVVSGTLLRHIVQIVPIGIGLGVLVRWPNRGAYAALPIFLFWALVVVLIWLFLLGLSRIASGHYTRTEVGSTIVMLASSIVGTTQCVRLGRRLPILGRLSIFVLFAAIQFVAMWISFLPSIANR